MKGRALADLRLVHARRGVPDADQPIRLAERQRLQQDAVDDAEEGDVGTDADAQREEVVTKNRGDRTNPRDIRPRRAPRKSMILQYARPNLL